VGPAGADRIADQGGRTAVNAQPVIPAPVESPGGERVFGQACDGGADRAHAILVVHEAAG
jgi:hypothetical protein